MYTVSIRYGLLPMVLIPKLTDVDEGIVCLSYLMEAEQQVPSQSICESYIVPKGRTILFT